MKSKKNILTFIFLTILVLFKSNLYGSVSTKIIASVDNQIISSYELKNKIKIIIFLNDQKPNQDIIDKSKKIALQQLINYKLKKNQILKFQIQARDNTQVNNYFKSLSKKYETDIKGLKKIFEINDLDFDLYYEEIKIEFDWQQLIFTTFKDKIILDENEINNEVKLLTKLQKKIEEYKLSEIEIPLKGNKEDENTFKEINDSINSIGFAKTAKKFSISNSSLDGGNIGWINAHSLSKEILNLIENMKIGEITKPIIQTDKAVFLKLTNKKILDSKNVDLNKLRKQIINNKKNELLNLYSNNYLSKIKNSALIELK
tara:strand:- start:10 stop:957 length:948 start_codon:yes stop_codon:yes gene_type:complete